MRKVYIDCPEIEIRLPEASSVYHWQVEPPNKFTATIVYKPQDHAYAKTAFGRFQKYDNLPGRFILQMQTTHSSKATLLLTKLTSGLQMICACTNRPNIAYSVVHSAPGSWGMG